MCHLICDIIGYCKVHIYDKIVIETRKKIWKSKKFLHKSPSKRWFRNGIHNLHKLADARGSADIIYHM